MAGRLALARGLVGVVVAAAWWAGCTEVGVNESRCSDYETYYRDADGDGFGDPEEDEKFCSEPSSQAEDPEEGYELSGDDCDDDNGLVHPGVTEVCNGVDDNCEDGVDEGFDADSDGFTSCGGDCADTDPDVHPGVEEACNGLDDDCDDVVPTEEVDDDSDGFRECDGDCEDANPDVHPQAEEVCDGVPDNNCDGNGDPQEGDYDTDLFTECDGDCNDAEVTIHPGAIESCNGVDDNCADGVDEGCGTDTDVDGYHDDVDCDDGDPAIYPGAVEVCNGVDDNCDGGVDEGFDGDGDGWTACEECDDAQAAVHPGAEEACNGIDDDCDGAADEGCPGVDGDGDGYPAETDCDDGDAAVHPGAAEICNEVDDDCGGGVDEGFDGDGDGVTTCGDDCNDADAEVSPLAPEVCNGVDDDCDLSIDDGLVFADWYLDADHDGHGDPAAKSTTCDGAPSGHVATGDDCDDAASWNFSGNPESCDGLDNDCNGAVDDGLAFVSWYPDEDGDGYGTGDGVVATCDGAPPEHVADGTDCNDGSAAVNPAASEVCNGLDDDCDLSDDEGFDSDGDGTADCFDAEECDGVDNDGDALVDDGFDGDHDGTTSCAGDCNDADATVEPGAPEMCDAVDNDCNGVVDDGIVYLDYFLDGDGDGYGAGTPVSDCVTPGEGYVLDGTDCDDAAAAVSPGAAEVCNDVDDDCDLGTDEGFDSDGDGVADCYDSEECDGVDNDGDAVIDEGFDGDVDGYTTCAGDCDDTNDDTNPGGAEVCNGLDDDCDDAADEGFDVDGDGTADCFDTETCDGVDNDGDAAIDEGFDGDGDGWTTCEGDCDDGAAGIHPEAEDVCDDIDQDCDGVVDEDEVLSPLFDLACATGVMIGQDHGDWFGSDVTSAGDLDGDGDNDLFIQALYHHADGVSNTGAVYSGLLPIVGTRTLGDSVKIAPALSAAVVGDQDDDGYPDLAVGAHVYTPGSVYLVPGPWYLYYGNLYYDEPAVRIDGWDGFGASLVVPGDQDGDGYDDVLIGTDGSGFGTILYGPLPDRNDVDVDYGDFWDPGDGLAMLEAGGPQVTDGDLSGDGVSDLIIGAPSGCAEGGYPCAGEVVVMLGPVAAGETVVREELAAVILGEFEDQDAGFAVDGHGDIDGDGYDDLLIGAPAKDAAGDPPGGVYVFYGPVSGELTLAEADGTLMGENADDAAGWDVAYGGDVNGDGYGDILVGACLHDAGAHQAGAAYVVLGPVSGEIPLSVADAKMISYQEGESAGCSVEGIGDMDGDGYGDMAVGAFNFAVDTDNPGAVYVVRGAPL